MIQLSKIKILIPPIILIIIRKFWNFSTHNINSQNIYGWTGNYISWEEAKKNSIGYDSSLIVDKVKKSTLEIMKNPSLYERDSVVFQKKEYSWPITSCLLWQASLNNNKKLNVMDFGGSLGSSYFQNKVFLDSINSIEWVVVEQENFLNIGVKHINSIGLKFMNFNNALEKEIMFDIVLFSSVLQYLSDVDLVINKVLLLKPNFILIDRTSFIEDITDRITIQNVPPDIYTASYPCRFFNENLFIKKFESNYDIISDFPSYCDSNSISDDSKKLYWKGFILKLKK
jgi:putative methyltransferase (TIGR04325 family)